VRRAGSVVPLILTAGALAGAQERPLRTHDPESIGAGQVLIETGVVHLRDQPYPVSGLRGHLTTAPVFGISLGVSGVAEIQIDNVSYQYLSVTERMPPIPGPAPPTFSGRSTSDWGDIVVGAKVRLLRETDHRPSLGLHFSTRLPNASTESWLGLDTMDFQNSVLVGKTFGAVRAVGNAGYAVLGDPTTVARQNDVVVYGASVVAQVSRAVAAVAEINGRANTRTTAVPPGTETSAYVTAGVRYELGPVRLDGAFIKGLHDQDADYGGTVGLTWRFSGLPVQ